jgi:hypothetical protein
MKALPKVPYSGIINENIEPSELLHSPTHRFLNVGFVCNRSGNREGLALFLHDSIYDPVQLPLPSSRNHDRSPFPRKGFRDRFTNTRVASRHDRNLSTQSIHRA